MSDPTFSPERWERVQQLFHAALSQPDDLRGEFLDTSCGEDSELRGAVASLLAAHERGGPLGPAILESTDVEEIITTGLRDRYRIEREIGAGGMASVFLALDIKHRRKVAIKVLRPELAVHLGIERFRREIEIAASLQHPNILALFDSGVCEGLLYYVMPYVEGDTLATRLDRERRIPPDETSRIASDLLGALEYAHREGVVHRDIKPGNILLSRSTGHALVADFGIARAISAAGADTLTQPGAAIGTPAYMPPEQARGERVTPATDVYATAMVLHECLTGRRFAGLTDDEANWAGVPGDFRSVLVRALQARPEDRWADGGAFRDALTNTRGPRLSLRRVRIWLTAAAVLVLGIAAWLFVSRATTGPTQDTSRLVVLPFSVQGTGALAYLGEGMVDLLSTKLDGAGEWRTVDPRAVLSLLTREGISGRIDPDDARRIGERLGASLFVLGNIVELGNSMRLDASLYDIASDEGVQVASAEGDASQVLALLDDVAAQLLSAQGIPGDARLTQIAAVTSQSLPALKSYLRGVRALRLGQFPSAVTAFQEAIALDSAFALAWYQLSIAADWMLRTDLALMAADQAVLYSTRLSDRDRELIEALALVRRGDLDGAERMYRRMIASYPEDSEAWAQLGELLFHFGPRQGRLLEDSREAWTRLNQLEPGRPTGYIHLARLEASQGDLVALDSVTQRALDLAAQGDRGLEMRTFRAFVGGAQAERDRIVEEMRQAPDDVFAEVIWSISAHVPEPWTIVPIIRAAIAESRSPELRARAYSALAYIEAGRGRLTASRAVLDTMASIDAAAALADGGYIAIARATIGDTSVVAEYRDRLRAVDWSAVPPSVNRVTWFSAHDGLYPFLRMYLLGVMNALLGDDVLATAYRDSIRAAPPPPMSGSLLPDFAYVIDATLARARGDNEAALDHLEAARLETWHQLAATSAFFNGGYLRYLRALVMEETGRLEEADTWYRTLHDTGPHDLVFLAPSHRRLAVIAEQSSDPNRAREHYQRFLDLWSDADDVLQPQVEDVRRRLDLISR